MPSNHKMIEITRYVGGETGWICESEIKATSATVQQIRYALTDCGEPYASQQAKLYTNTIGEYLTERAAMERWERKRERYLMLALRRKTQQSTE